MDLVEAFQKAKEERNFTQYKVVSVELSSVYKLTTGLLFSQLQEQLILAVRKNPAVISDWPKDLIEEVVAATGPQTQYILKLWDNLKDTEAPDSEEDESSSDADVDMLAC